MESPEEGYLEPGTLTAFRDGSNVLCVRIDGRGEWRKVTVRRAFPYTDTDRYVGLYCDDKEIGVIRDLDELGADSRAVLQETLRKRYHMPVIERILAVEEVHNATRWHVETAGGPCSFEIQSRRSFRQLDDGAMIIIDVDTNRFRIPDRGALDAASRDLLDLHI